MDAHQDNTIDATALPPAPRLAPGTLLPGEVEIGRLLASHGGRNIYSAEDFGGQLTVVEQAGDNDTTCIYDEILAGLLLDWPETSHRNGRRYAIFRGKPDLNLKHLELNCDEPLITGFLLQHIEAVLQLQAAGASIADLGPEDIYMEGGRPCFLIFPLPAPAQQDPGALIKKIVRQVLFFNLLPKTTRNLEAPLRCLGLTWEMEQILTAYLDDGDWQRLHAWLCRRSREVPPCWEIQGLTHIGLVRDHNEDAFGWQMSQFTTHHRQSQTCLLAVSDGMGGHQLGEEASHLALTEFMATLEDGLRSSDLSGGMRERLVGAAFDNAATKVRDSFEHMRHDARPGATLVGGHLSGRRLYLGNCGDSRAYLFADDCLRQITIDHSLLQLYVDRGILSAEEAENTDNSVITSFIGMEEKSYRRDVFTIHMPPGSWLLLCSDGLTDMVRNERIAELMGQATNCYQAAESLLAEALNNGGHDNITVLLLHDNAMPAYPEEIEEDQPTLDPEPARPTSTDDDTRPQPTSEKENGEKDEC